jgi:hypothetical protein
MATKYLSEYGFPFLPTIDFYSEWKKVQAAAKKHPWSNYHGYFDSKLSWLKYCSSMQIANTAWSVHQWKNKDFLDQVYRSRYWLSQCEFIKTLNRRHSSYGYKHGAENWWGRVQKTFELSPVRSSYISNGCLIMAALTLGLNFSNRWGGQCSLNVALPIGEKSLKHLKRDFTDVFYPN